MAVPDYQSLMLPLLRLAAGGETSIPEMEGRLAAALGLTEAERSALLPSGKQSVLHNRMHWAKVYMTRAGLIDSPRRGRFVASAAGRALLARDPARIDVALLQDYPAFREFYRSSRPAAPGTAAPAPSEALGPEAASATPDDQIEAIYAAHRAALRAELVARILQNPPGFFETVVVALLVAMGYGGSHRNAAQQLGRSGDGGVDGVINEDPLGLDRVYVQAKRYQAATTVGRPDVQAFLGSLVGLGAAKGVFVTTSSFSAQAVAFVQHLPQRIVLIDGERLGDLMIEHHVGVRLSRAVAFKRLDEDFFAEED